MNFVEVNGKMYPKEDVEKAQEVVMEVWGSVKGVISDMLVAITASIYTFIQALTERGYTEEQAVEYLSTIIQQ